MATRAVYHVVSGIFGYFFKQLVRFINWLLPESWRFQTDESAA